MESFNFEFFSDLYKDVEPTHDMKIKIHQRDVQCQLFNYGNGLQHFANLKVRNYLFE